MPDEESLKPRSGIDYPRDLNEFHQFFLSEESCRRYLEHVKWRDGFLCRVCGKKSQPWRVRRDVLMCPHCEAESRLTAGTVLEGTRKPLRLRFLAMWGGADQPEVWSQRAWASKGSRSEELHDRLGLASPKRARARPPEHAILLLIISGYDDRGASQSAMFGRIRSCDKIKLTFLVPYSMLYEWKSVSGYSESS